MILLTRLLPVLRAIFHISSLGLSFCLFIFRAKPGFRFRSRSISDNIFVFLLIGFRGLRRHILHRFVHFRTDVAFALFRVEFVNARDVGDDFRVGIRLCFGFHFKGFRLRCGGFRLRNRRIEARFEGSPAGFVFCENEELLVGISLELRQDQVVHTAEQAEEFTHFTRHFPHYLEVRIEMIFIQLVHLPLLSPQVQVLVLPVVDILNNIAHPFKIGMYRFFLPCSRIFGYAVNDDRQNIMPLFLQQLQPTAHALS